MSFMTAVVQDYNLWFLAATVVLLLWAIGTIMADSQRDSEDDTGLLNLVLIIDFYNEDTVRMPVKNIVQAQQLLNRIIYGSIHDARVCDLKSKRILHYLNDNGVLV